MKKFFERHTGLVFAIVLASAYAVTAESSEFAASFVGTDAFSLWSEPVPRPIEKGSATVPKSNPLAKYSAATYGVCGKSWCHELPVSVSSKGPYGRCVPTGYLEANFSPPPEWCRKAVGLSES